MRISSTSTLAWIIVAYVLSLNVYYVIVPGGFGRTSVVDEMFALALSPFATYFVLHANKRMRTIIGFLGGYFVLLAASSLSQMTYGTAGTPWQAPLWGIALDLKPLFFVFGLMFFYERLRPELRTKALGQLCHAIVGLGLLNAAVAVVQIITGSSPTISGNLQVNTDFGYVPVGLFGHKVQIATLLSVAFLASCALYAEYKRSRYLLAATMLASVLIACNSAKELVALPLGAIVVFLSLPQGRHGRPNLLRVLLLLASPPLLYVAWLVLEDLLADRVALYLFGTSVRGLMYQVSAQIAVDYFPLGSGAGTFGSAPSRDIYYSNLYHYYGLSGHYGASPLYSSYLMDTWWPKILAESGFVGAILYAIALIAPLRISLKSYARLPGIANILAWTMLTLLLCVALGSAAFNSDHGMLVWGLSFVTMATLSTKHATLIKDAASPPRYRASFWSSP